MGKGTQCSRLAIDLNFEHISVGELLREEANRPSSVYADFINKSILESIVIPAQLTCDLIKTKMNSAMQKGIKAFLIDGFPRSLDQAINFEEKVCTGPASNIAYLTIGLFRFTNKTLPFS